MRASKCSEGEHSRAVLTPGAAWALDGQVVQDHLDFVALALRHDLAHEI